MTSVALSISTQPLDADAYSQGRSAWGLALRSGRVIVGGGVILVVLLICISTLSWSLPIYSKTNGETARQGPGFVSKTSPDQSRWQHPAGWFGYDMLGRSTLARSLLGGTISLAV